MKTVSVKFLESESRNYPSQHKHYDYLVPQRLPDPEVGGHVVVVGGDGRYCVCRVEKVVDYASHKATKRIVCVVNDADFLAQKDREARKVEVMAALTAMDKKRREMTRLRESAVGDPTMEALIKEMETLDDTQ